MQAHEDENFQYLYKTYTLPLGKKTELCQIKKWL